MLCAHVNCLALDVFVNRVSRPRRLERWYCCPSGPGRGEPEGEGGNKGERGRRDSKIGDGKKEKEIKKMN